MSESQTMISNLDLPDLNEDNWENYIARLLYYIMSMIVMVTNGVKLIDPVNYDLSAMLSNALQASFYGNNPKDVLNKHWQLDFEKISSSFEKGRLDSLSNTIGGRKIKRKVTEQEVKNCVRELFQNDSKLRNVFFNKWTFHYCNMFFYTRPNRFYWNLLFFNSKNCE
jgi:hypothetical protein